MKRYITIKNSIPFKQDERKCAIYKIMFGEKYYIGRSIQVKARMSQHKYLIEKLLLKDTIEDYHYFKKVYHHLIANPDINEFTVVILEECDPIGILEREQYWFMMSYYDPNCLNIGFIANPSSHDTRMANLAKNEAGIEEQETDAQ